MTALAQQPEREAELAAKLNRISDLQYDNIRPMYRPDFFARMAERFKPGEECL